MGRFPSFVFAVVLTAFFATSGGLRIGITHWNDVSGQLASFEQGTSDSSLAPVECTTRDDCIGGLQNLVHWIHDNTTFNEKAVPEENILRLTSGNLIGGESGWISSINNSWTKYGDVVCQHYKPTVTALGMKEFGAGVDRTIAYIKANETSDSSCFPVTVANTCGAGDEGVEAEFCKLREPIKMITVFENDKSTYQIGVIGFVTPTVMNLSLPGELSFGPIIDSIKEQVTKHAHETPTFIALGDGSLAISKLILEQVPEVKLVIYGMGLGSSKNMSGDYPMKYDGERYIATAGKYGSSVGKLVFDIDTTTGLLALVDQSLQVTSTPDKYNPEADSAGNTFDLLKGEVEADKNDKVGRTRVALHGGETCWRNECNLGNLVTDAMVHCALVNDYNTGSIPSNFPLHSIWHGGALFEDVIEAGESISKFDIHKWLPFHNRVHLVKIKGEDLLRVFEVSATGIDPEKAGVKDWRQFLQVSNGFEVHYNTRGESPILTGVRMAHDKNGVPTMSDLQGELEYYLVIPTFLYDGRGLYGFTKEMWKDVVPNKSFEFDDNCLAGYISALSQISVGLEERIFIDDDGGGTIPTSTDAPPPPPECKKCKGSNTAVTVILTLVFFIIFLAIIYIGYFFVLPRLRQSRTIVEYPPNQL